MTARAEPEPLHFVVEDSFRIRGRGVVLAPTFEAERFPNGTRLAVSIGDSTPEPRTVPGRFVLEHLRLAGGGSRWHGVVILDEPADPVEPGTTIVCVPST